MQSPAKPKGCRGRVTATKHIGLDSFRVRNCEPGTNDRQPIDRTSRCWNDDFDFGPYWPSSGPRAPSRRIVPLHDHDRRRPLSDKIELQWECASGADVSTRERALSRPGSVLVQCLSRSSPLHNSDSGPLVIERAVHPCRLVLASGRNAPFFVLFRPFFSTSVFKRTPRDDDERQPGLRRMTRFVVATTCSRSGPRTHSFKRVSYEKRNADERPPTGGKSDCHR